jgi:hypothetical protein
MAISYNTSVVRDGLVLYLDAANPKSYPETGTTWFGLNGNTASLLNGVTYTSNNLGSFNFDGIDDLCRTSIPVSTLDNIFTVCIWFTLTSTTSSNPDAVSKRLISADQSNGSTKWCIGTTPSRQLLFGGSGGTQRTLNYVIELNQIYYAVVTHNSTTYSLFINGVNQIRNDTSGIASPNFGNVSIACRPNSIDRLWTGAVFSSMFYNRVLTDEEIKKNFEATRGRYGI